MSYTTSDEVMIEPYEEVVDSPHYNSSSSRSSSSVVEEDRSLAETFKGPIVNSSRGVEITAQTGSVASAAWPALGRLMLAIAEQLQLVQEPQSQAKADVAIIHRTGK